MKTITYVQLPDKVDKAWESANFFIMHKRSERYSVNIVNVQRNAPEKYALSYFEYRRDQVWLSSTLTCPIFFFCPTTLTSF